ncbi:MAG: type II secretion system protein [Candidatus Ozemobacteraceae bacterium]
MKFGRSRLGVTLIELMLAFVILCISALSAASIMGYGHKGTAKEFLRIEALQILTERLNRLGAFPFSKARAYTLVDSGNITNTVEGMEFGTVKIGKNSYDVKAKLNFQPITFPNIMCLKLPNPNYKMDDVNTWLFQDTAIPTINDKVIKVVVSVKPIEKNNKVVFEAMTFIVDME